MAGLAVDWLQLCRVAAKIAAAYVLALPTGWVREKQEHAVGIRTFPLVAMASCGYLLIFSGPGGPDVLAAKSRVLQGLVTGIGFVGGGAILKEGTSVHGTATAASIWNTAAIGASIALGRYEIGLVLALLNLFTMKALVPIKQRLDRGVGSSSPEQAHCVEQR